MDEQNLDVRIDGTRKTKTKRKKKRNAVIFWVGSYRILNYNVGQTTFSQTTFSHRLGHCRDRRRGGSAAAAIQTVANFLAPGEKHDEKLGVRVYIHKK